MKLGCNAPCTALLPMNHNAPPPADPNQPSACRQRLTAAHLAARWGHPAVLRLLHQHGADLRKECGGQGWAPLAEAQNWRRHECVAVLEVLLAGELGAA